MEGSDAVAIRLPLRRRYASSPTGGSASRTVVFVDSSNNRHLRSMSRFMARRLHGCSHA